LWTDIVLWNKIHQWLYKCETLSSKCQLPTHDPWYKEKNMTKDRNKNMRKRSYKRGPFLFPTLSKRKSQQRIWRESFHIVPNIAKETNKCSSNFGNHTIAIGSKHDWQT
jgi:hypothetical protein